jgi:hypothetical protein
MNAFGLALVWFLKGIEYDYCLNDLDAQRAIFQEEMKPIPVTGRSIVFTLLIFSYKFKQNLCRVFIVSTRKCIGIFLFEVPYMDCHYPNPGESVRAGSGRKTPEIGRKVEAVIR